MKKTILRVVSGAMVLAILATSSVAVAAADDKKEREPAQKTEQAAVDKTQRAAEQAQGKDQSQVAAGDNVPKGQIQDRILQIRNEARVDAALTRLVAAGQLTQQKADQIKELWLKKHENHQPPYGQVLQRILEMRNPDNVQAVLARLVTTGRITQEESDRIWEQWQKQHENDNDLPYGQVLQRILDMKSLERVQAVLDRLVENGKISQSDADKILEKWHKIHDA